jgi:hypothetical protein
MTRVSEVISNSSQTHRVCGLKGGIVDASKEKRKESSRQEKGS